MTANEEQQAPREIKTDERAAGGGWLKIALALAVLLRIGVCLEYQARHPWADRPVIDEASYESWALEVASGDWQGQGVFFQEPLYPYSLALVYRLSGSIPKDELGQVTGVASQRQRTAARHLQAALGALLVYLVYRMTRLAFGAGPALIAAFGMATYRPLLLLPSLLLKPNAFLPVVVGLLVMLLAAAREPLGSRASLWRWLGVGALGGAAALLRGNALVLLPFLLLSPFLFHRSLRAGASAMAAFLGVLALLLPVALRNQAVGGVFALSTSGAGTNVYGGNAPENPYGLAKEFPWVRGIPEHEAEDWRREAERRVGHVLDSGAVSSYWLHELGRVVREDPMGEGLRLWHKLRLTLGRYEVPDNHDLEWDARYLWSLRAPLPGWGLWGSLGLAGLMLWVGFKHKLGADRSPAAWALALCFLLYLGTIVLTVTSARIRLMLVPLLMPFGAWILWLLLGRCEPLARRLRARTRAPLPVLIAFLAAGVAIVFTPVLPAGMAAQKLDGRDMNQARILLEQPDGLDQAAQLVQRLTQSYPNDPRVATLAAEVSFRRAGVLLAQEPSDVVGAGAELRTAMSLLAPLASDERVDPKERFRARVLAGLCQLRAGSNPAAARRHFESALAWDPTDRVARLGLANSLALEAQAAADQGQKKQARELRTRSMDLLAGLRSEKDEEALVRRQVELKELLGSQSP